MIRFKMMFNMSMLRHRFSNERWSRPESPSSLKATSHSTIFDIPMRLVRKDQGHRRRCTR